MTGRTWIARGLTLAAATFALAAMPPAAVAQSLDIEGLWLVQVQLRNCQTQAPLGAPFNSLVSFLSGGSVVEATEAPAFAPSGPRAMDASRAAHLQPADAGAHRVRHPAQSSGFARVRPRRVDRVADRRDDEQCGVHVERDQPVLRRGGATLSVGVCDGQRPALLPLATSRHSDRCITWMSTGPCCG
jgi:hypothetical protein